MGRLWAQSLKVLSQTGLRSTYPAGAGNKGEGSTSIQQHVHIVAFPLTMEDWIHTRKDNTGAVQDIGATEKHTLTVYRGHIPCSRAQASHPKRIFLLYLLFSSSGQ